jgi:hypothetical protein
MQLRFPPKRCHQASPFPRQPAAFTLPSRPRCGNRTAGGSCEERRMTTTFILGEDVHFGLELGVRLDRSRAWPKPCRARLLPSWCRAAERRRCRRARLPSSLRNISMSVAVVLRCPSSRRFRLRHLLETPRSTRPVTTVPRPSMLNTSSTHIRKGLSTSRAGQGMKLSSASSSSAIAFSPSAFPPWPPWRNHGRSGSCRQGSHTW